MTDQVTPVQIERRLFELVNELAAAQFVLVKARDREVELKHAAERSARQAMFSPECPRVGRGESTVAERDAWIDMESALEREAYEVAEATRKASQDHINTLNTQAMVVMALSKSVLMSYGLAGHS